MRGRGRVLGPRANDLEAPPLLRPGHGRRPVRLRRAQISQDPLPDHDPALPRGMVHSTATRPASPSDGSAGSSSSNLGLEETLRRLAALIERSPAPRLASVARVALGFSVPCRLESARRTDFVWLPSRMRPRREAWKDGVVQAAHPGRPLRRNAPSGRIRRLPRLGPRHDRGDLQGIRFPVPAPTPSEEDPSACPPSLLIEPPPAACGCEPLRPASPAWRHRPAAPTGAEAPEIGSLATRAFLWRDFRSRPRHYPIRPTTAPRAASSTLVHSRPRSAPR